MRVKSVGHDFDILFQQLIHLNETIMTMDIHLVSSNDNQDLSIIS